MTIDELRDVLHEHSGDPEAVGTQERIRSVRHRVGVRRRRRAAAVAGATIAAVATVALVVVPSLGTPRGAVPVAPAASPESQRHDVDVDVPRSLDLPESVDYLGETWVLDSVEETGPGEELLTIEAGRAGREVLLVEAHQGLEAPAAYEVLVDGDYVGGARLTRGDVAVDGLEGDLSKPWLFAERLEPGRGQTVSLQVLSGSTDRALLTLAQYVRPD